MAVAKINDNNFITIQAFMVKDLGLKGNDLLIYAIIYAFSQDGISKFTGSLNYLAAWTNSSKNGVQKNIKTLLEKGYIEKRENIKGSIKYCEYSCIPYNSVVRAIQQSCTSHTTQLDGTIQLSCTNNIDNNKEYNIDNILLHGVENNSIPKTPFIALILNDKSEYPIYNENVAEWKELYPSVNIEQALRNMKGWLIANPKQRKTKTGILRFINTWLSKEQNKGVYNKANNKASGLQFFND